MTAHSTLTGLNNDDHPQYLKETDANAKGDIFVATANDTVTRLAVGTDGQILQADSTATEGVKWVAPGAPPSVFISPWSPESLGISGGSGAAPASAVWPTANRGFYVPFYVPIACTAYRMFVLNGATATNGTVDLGIYETASGDLKPGARLVSAGATATAGTSVCQFLDIADTPLVGGSVYFMAISLSSVSDTVFRVSGLAVQNLSALGVFSQTAIGTLPDPAVPAAPTAFLPMFGVALRSTP